MTEPEGLRPSEGDEAMTGGPAAEARTTPASSCPGDTSVVVVGHNAREQLEVGLASLWRAGCPRDRVTVMDVASTDGTGQWLRDRFPGVGVRRLERNRGPGEARNLGIREARTPYVFVMDADVSVETATIPVLRDAVARDPGVALATPVVVYADRPDVVQYAETRLHFLCEALNPWEGRPVAERGDAPRDVGCAPACGIMVRRWAALEVGLFDSRYFLGKEDGDFTHRLRIAGHRLVEDPAARVHHRHRTRGTHLFPVQIRNRWHLMLKTYQLRTLVALAPVLALHEVLQVGLLVSKGHGRAYLRAMGGLVRMLPRLPRDRARVASIRRRPDRELLASGPIVVREDMLSNRLFREAKRIYEGVANGFWRLFRRAAP